MNERAAIKNPAEPALLRRLADRFGTPLYVYEERVIRARIAALRSHLEGVRVHLSYACKANSSLPVLRVMLEEGLGVDVVSPAELELARRVGFPQRRILFSANNMTDEEMTSSQTSGVLLNVGELSRLERFGRAYPGASVCVRLNPLIGAGHHDHVITAGVRSKFGIPVAQLNEVSVIVRNHGLKLVGLHQHIGSGILDTDVLWQALSVMLESASAFESLEFVNLGGGLGIPYRPNELPLDLDSWEHKIVHPLAEFVRNHPSENLSIGFEPGRYLVAESGSLLVRANTIKKTPDRVFVGVDSGMGHLVRPAMYDAYHAIFNLSNPDAALAEYDIVGNICESADFFARGRMIQEIREGDLLCVMDAGAYGMSMASVYNLRPLPAEVWVPASGSDPELITVRETASEMIDRLYPGLSQARKDVGSSG